MGREAWSADREFSTARGLGCYSPRGQEVLRLAGMSLASLSNIPSQLSSLDYSQAVSYISKYLDSSHSGDSAQSGAPASGPHDFSEYLQRVKTWDLVMAEPDPLRNTSGQSSTASPLRLSRSARTRESDPEARDVGSVPSIFFEDSFDVEDSATFHAACPIGDLGESQCIKKLEGHLDKVECALEAEVTARAAELVDASIDIGRVGHAVKDVHKHTTAVRERVFTSAEDKLWEHDTLQTLKSRKARWTSIQLTVSQSIEIRQALASVGSLMDVSDWLTAADTITLVDCLHSKAPSTSRLDCLASVPTQLTELRGALQKNLMVALQSAAEFKGMDELTMNCCRELEMATSLEAFSFTGDLTSHFSKGGEGGLGLPPSAGPDGNLPAIWELQQAALWPPLMAAQRTGSLEPCLSAYSEAAVAATRSAVGSHLHACVHALLRSERKGAGESMAPPTNAPLEDLLQWLRPVAFAALLQSLQLLLRVLQWFYGGCAVLMDASLGTVDATAAERAMCHSCNTEALRKVVEAFQQRWAWLLSAAYASELEQYSVGGPEAAAPVTLGQFLTVTEMSREVESMCSAAGSPAAAVLNSLKTLGKHLLKGHASGLQGQLELVLSSEPWTTCMVDATVQHFIDDLFNPTPGSNSLSRRGSSRRETNGSRVTATNSGTSSINGTSHESSASGSEPGGPSTSRNTAEKVASPRMTNSSNGQESSTSKTLDGAVSEDGVTAASLVSALDSAATKNAAAERLQQSLRAGNDGHGNPADATVLATGASAAASSGVTSSSEPLKDCGSDGAVNGQASGGAGSGPPTIEVETAASVVVGEERYVVVSSVALLLQHLDALLAFGHVSLALRYEMGSRIAELIRVFNVRSSELLLGAGAIASAGLRSITARHMAVCSQCLLLLEVLLPRLRYVALGGLPAVQVASLASLFEAVTEGVAQHRQQIHSKLVNIMRERLSTSLKALHATSTSWAAYNPGTTPLNGAATPRNTPNDTPQNPTEVARADSLRAASPTLKPRTVAKMMLQIARQVTTLHEALAPVMSRSQQAEIGMRVRRMYSEALARGLRSLQPNGEAWLHAAEHDVTIVIEALKLLPGKTGMQGLEGIGEYLQQVQDLLSDTKRAADLAAAPLSLEDDVATAVDDLTDDIVQSARSTADSVANLDSNADELVEKVDADSSAVQNSSDVAGASKAGDMGPCAVQDQPAEAPAEAGDVGQDAVQQQSPGETTAGDEQENVPVQGSSQPAA